MDVLQDWKFIHDNGIVPICSGDVWRKVLSKENVSTCISLHSAVTLEEVIVALFCTPHPILCG